MSFLKTHVELVVDADVVGNTGSNRRGEGDVQQGTDSRGKPTDQARLRGREGDASKVQQGTTGAWGALDSGMDLFSEGSHSI